MSTVKMGVWEEALFTKLAALRTREQYWLNRIMTCFSLQYTAPVLISSGVFAATVSTAASPSAATYVGVTVS